jgi:hypothetical protein
METIKRPVVVKIRRERREDQRRTDTCYYAAINPIDFTLL